MSAGTGGVAIVVPAWNAERTLAETLSSATQEPEAREIVVIDDGSTDGTLSVARRFDPRVRVLTVPNGGVSAARNLGIAETTADWLLFLDSDDLLVAGTLAQRLAVAGVSDADAVVTDWEEIADNGAGAVTPGARRCVDWDAIGIDAEIAIARSVWATTAAILYRRDLVQRIGGFRADLPVIQDARFFFDAAYHKARFVHAPHVGARYRIVAASLSRRDPVRFWLDVLRNGQQIEALWRQRGSLNSAQRQTLHGIYNNAARALFVSAHPGYFEAVTSQKGTGQRLSRHARWVTPLAHCVGLKTAQQILSLAGQR